MCAHVSAFISYSMLIYSLSRFFYINFIGGQRARHWHRRSSVRLCTKFVCVIFFTSSVFFFCVSAAVRVYCKFFDCDTMVCVQCELHCVSNTWMEYYAPHRLYYWVMHRFFFYEWWCCCCCCCFVVRFVDRALNSVDVMLIVEDFRLIKSFSSNAIADFIILTTYIYTIWYFISIFLVVKRWRQPQYWLFVRWQNIFQFTITYDHLCVCTVIYPFYLQ